MAQGQQLVFETTLHKRGATTLAVTIPSGMIERLGLEPDDVVELTYHEGNEARIVVTRTGRKRPKR